VLADFLDETRRYAIENSGRSSLDLWVATNGEHVSFGQLRSMMGFAFMLASLSNLIGHIIGMSAKKQMSRIAAALIITTMQYLKTIRDWSDI
jgi:hypothetical protein